MHYRKGKNNGNADAMSRIPLRAQDPPDSLVDTRETAEICAVKVQEGEQKEEIFLEPRSLRNRKSSVGVRNEGGTA